IRDRTVTGVQTCALPICQEDAFSLSLCRQYLPLRRYTGKALVASAGHVYYDIDERWIGLVEYPSPRFVRHGTITLPAGTTEAFRSEERRGGKECAARWEA